jgi:hypothetical protein
MPQATISLLSPKSAQGIYQKKVLLGAGHKTIMKATWTQSSKA